MGQADEAQMPFETLLGCANLLGFYGETIWWTRSAS